MLTAVLLWSVGFMALTVWTVWSFFVGTDFDGLSVPMEVIWLASLAVGLVLWLAFLHYGIRALGHASDTKTEKISKTVRQI